jgi:hypothetical protein
MGFDTPTASPKYNYLLQIFMNYVFKQENNEKMHDVLDKILSVCEKQSIQILEKIEGKKFQMMYHLLKKYKHEFFLSDEFYEQMEHIYNIKNNQTEIIVLSPTLSDLQQHMIYKLVKDDQVYLVPLWHNELVYEHYGKEFIVRCVPDFPNEDIWIDDENHIHCNKTYSVVDLLQKSKRKEMVDIQLGEKTVTFLPCELRLANQPQMLRWKGEGISKISKEVYDVSKKSDIICHIVLEE